MFGSGVNLGNAYGSIVIGTGDISKAVGNAKNILRAGFSDMSGMAKSWGGDLIQTGATLGLATAPLSIGFAKATKDLIEFDSTMGLIGTNLQKPISQLGDLKENLLNLGGSSVEGANAAAKAMLVVTGGIQDVSKQWGALTAAQKLSEAGNATWESGANGIVTMLNAYSKSADVTADSIADVYVQSARMGREQLDVVIPSLSSIAATAVMAGVSLRDMGKETTYLEAAGASQSAATIRWQAATMAFIKPNEKLKEAIKALGYESGSAMIHQEGLSGSLAILAKKFGSTDEAMSPFFSNLRAWQGVAGLLNEDTKDFFRIYDEGLDGIAEKNRAINLETIANQFKLASSKAEEMGIRIASTLMPVLLQLIDIVKPVLFNITEWIKLNPDLTAQIAGVAAALVVLAPAMMMVGGTLNFLQMGFAFLASPIGLVVAALGLLYVAFQNNFGGIQQILQPVLERLQNTFTMVSAYVTRFFLAIQSGQSIVEAAKEFIGGFIGQIVLLFGGTIEQAITFRDAFNALWDTAGKVINTIFNTIKSVVASVWPIIENIFNALLKIIRDDIMPLLPKLQLAFEFLWNGAADILQTVWPQIETVLNALVHIVEAYIMPVLKTFADWFITYGIPSIVNIITWFVNQIWTPLFGVVAKLWEVIKPALDAFFNWFAGEGGGFNQIMNVIRFFMAFIWKPLTDVVGGIWNMVMGALTTFLNWFVADGVGWKVIGNAINTFKTDTWNPIVKAISGFWDSVKSGLQAFSANFGGFLEKPMSGLRELGRIVDQVFGRIDTLRSQWDALQGAIAQNPSADLGGAIWDAIGKEFHWGGKATGGNAKAGATYRINENGTEWLTMGGQSGNIATRPNGGGGDGMVFNSGAIVINADTYEGGKKAAQGFKDEFMDKFRSRG